jgi:serine/threonine protein phosphatase PrpC
MTADPARAAISCPSCGRLASPQDNFCEACRTELAPAVPSTGTGGPGPACPFCPSATISPEGYCESCGRKAPAGRDHSELDLGLLAGVTDRGLRHHRNEDAMALATAETASGPAAVAVVCDGVSSSGRPDEASLAAAQAAAAVLLTAVRAGADLVRASAEAVRAAQQAVTGLTQLAPGDPAQRNLAPGEMPVRSLAPDDAPAATFVSAVLAAGTVTLCWLGDSRAYWLQASTEAPAGDPPPAAEPLAAEPVVTQPMTLQPPAGRPMSRQLTRDDSLAEEMIAAGLLAEADALSVPQAHVVTRWVGADLRGATPHMARFTPTGPGAVLLCSDGLWNYQPEAAELTRLALPRALADPLGAAASLVRFALDAGGHDNITAVLMPSPPAWPPATGRQDLPTSASA